jgi:bacteriocin-like protein
MLNKAKSRLAGKKLSKNQMKKISGGAPPLPCGQACQDEFYNCLLSGATFAQCKFARTICVNCDCYAQC